jgi:ubiquinone/menaquinone biosynthesis C-methylase UbiE
MAEGYAFRRPPVHREIMRAIVGRLPAGGDIRALDIGCGAGLSTSALAPVASTLVGLEPVAAMLAHSAVVAPGARFVIGRAERLPFGDATFDLVAAAGSLNYVSLDLFLPEAARVLGRDGALLVYDYSAARRLLDDRRLDEWFASFERRWPFPRGYEMDVRTIDLRAAGLMLRSYDVLEVTVPMTAAAYLDYVMSETNVEVAVSGGADEREVWRWCESPLREVFGDGAREVLFDAYAAIISRA